MRKGWETDKLYQETTVSSLLPSLKINISLKIQGTFLKGQINISGFLGHVVTTTTTQFLLLSEKLATDKMSLIKKEKKKKSQYKFGLWAIVVQPLS